ncbi:MAG: RdgB/HAM1 family non-canonical purine NTP pyrophosphatase [Clostridia bacterium]|nr:RdgB/HAM1 family non-canonical purine NTP pyrophosphatase [Clostridia bacterium]
MTYYLATKNMKKLAELQRILGPAGIDVICEKDLETPLDEVEETGETFEENALLKAEAAASALGIPAIADDSGLVVDALGGRPGVYSARFAGEDCNDENNIDKLLGLMINVPENERTARFVSAVACVYPDGRKFTVRGTVEGSIAYERIGKGGFGYDPVFITELGSFGEISAEAKDSISHRGRALRKLKGRLCDEKILIFGGTFDPPHKAHRDMLEAAVKATGANKVLVIPTATPPHKEREGITNAEHRMEMCRLAFGDIPEAEISAMEIERGGKSYTVDTLTAIKAIEPEKELMLLCGGDMFATLDSWVRAKDILKMATVVGVSRPGYEKEFLESAKRLWNMAASVEIISEAMPDISSTDIRNDLVASENKISDKVAEYIKANGLYENR